MKNVRRNAVIVTVLLFVCVAVYLNWSYNNRWGEPDQSMVIIEDNAMREAEESYRRQPDDVEEASVRNAVSDYFAAARLTRQQSRDEALDLLQQAAAAELASKEVIDVAITEITVMATNSLQEAQIENLLIAKNFADCVVFITGDTITVAVPAPQEGLEATAVAQITDIITTETGVPASQLRIIEVRA